MKKRSFVFLLAVLMMLGLSSVGALAGTEGRDGAYDQTLVVGADGFSDLQAALDSLEGTANGKVLVQFTQNFDGRSNGAYIVPSDKGITSVTFGTEEGKTVSIGTSYFDVFANGVPLIIDRGVTMSLYCTVYGGGSEGTAVPGNTSITVNQGGAIKGSLYGGGKNSPVGGSVALTLHGTVSSVHGGGRAVSATKDVDKSANADVKGSVSIVLGRDSTLTGDLFGGGQAYSGATGVSAEQLQANVGGNVTLSILSASVKGANIYGGGHAYQVTGTGVRTLKADVAGRVTIDVGGDMQYVQSSRGSLYGGGRAQSLSKTDEGSLVSARVGKAIRVDASKDNDASGPHDDWDNSMFMRLYGGGFAKGSYTDATVYSTSVITSRKAIDGSAGLFGGGYTENDGTARVETNTQVEVCKSASQGSDHDNAKNVFGGGHSVSTGDSTVLGDTSVTINGDMTFEPGGYVYGGGWNAADGAADVKGRSTVVMRGATHPSGVSPGGKGSSVTQASTVQFIGTCTLSLRTGGGPITEGVTVLIGDGTTETHVGTSFIYSADSVDKRIAKVEVKDKATLAQQANTNALFWNTADLVIEKGGHVLVDNTSTSNEDISGTLSGEGTLTLPAGKQLVVRGSFDGDLRFAVSGTPVAGATCAWTPLDQPGTLTYDGPGYLLVKTDTGSWSRWDLAVARTVTATVTGPEGGSVSPETQIVPVGGEAVFTLTRNPGYKVASVLVDGVDQPVEDDKFTVSSVQADTSVTVTFEKMTAADVANVVQTLPGGDAPQVPPEKVPDILDTKMDYEALDPAEKGQIDAGTRHKLNTALAALPQVQLIVTGPASVVEPPTLMETMTGDEAAALKNGAYTAYNLFVVISETTPDDENEKASIDTALDGALQGAHYDVSVKKEVRLADDPDHPLASSLTTLPHPLELVFSIPEALRAAPEGVDRSFRMLRTHLENGVYTTTVLADLDQDPATYTVVSDRFSTYTLAYEDQFNSAAFHVVASAGPGGTISPSGSVQVQKNGSLSFAIQPAAGYYIQDVLVDGVSVGAVDTYTFQKVQEDHAIAAFFTQAKADVGTGTGTGHGTVGGLGGGARTGDRANPALWSLLLLMAGAAMTGTVFALGKKQRN